MPFIIRSVASCYLFLILEFQISRAVFYTKYFDYFRQASLGEFLLIILVGFRFDLMAITLYFGTPFLLLGIPWLNAHTRQRLLIGIFVWQLLVLFFVMGIQFADLIYFEQVKRRLSFEVNFLFSDATAIIGLSAKEYTFAFLAFPLVFALTGYLWYRYSWSKILYEPWRQESVKYWHSLILFFSYLIFGIIAGRGGFQLKPLSESAAFISEKQNLGHLALNAPLTVGRQLLRPGIRTLDVIPNDISRATVQKLLSAPETEFVDPRNRPFLRRYTNPVPRDKNVVLIIMESWGAETTGVMTGEKKSPTPAFDELSKNGILFDNFYANGTRSIHGNLALMAGIPPLKNLAMLETSLVTTSVTSIPAILKKRNYHSYYVYAAKDGSLGILPFMRQLGMDRTFAETDFRDSDKHYDGTWGMWDEEMFSQTVDFLNTSPVPFFMGIFTLSSHEPYALPDPKFNVFGEASDEQRWKNLIYYSDYALGKFFEKASKQPWFANTIFIITGDHNGKLKKETYDSRVPLLILGTDVTPGINSTLGSQVDVMPTILDLLGSDQPFAAAGKSLFGNTPVRFAYFDLYHDYWRQDDQILTAVDFSPKELRTRNPDGTISQSDVSTNPQKTEELRTNLISWLQEIQNAIVRNKLVKE